MLIHGDYIRDIIGLILFILSILLLISLISFDPHDSAELYSSPNIATMNWMGPPGAWVSTILRIIWGKSAIIIPFLLFISGFFILTGRYSKIIAINNAGFLLLIPAFSILMSTLHTDIPDYSSGGIIGVSLSRIIREGTNKTVLYIINFLLFGGSLFVYAYIIREELVRDNKLWNKFFNYITGKEIEKKRYRDFSFLSSTVLSEESRESLSLQESYKGKPKEPAIQNVKLPWIVKIPIDYADEYRKNIFNQYKHPEPPEFLFTNTELQTEYSNSIQTEPVKKIFHNKSIQLDSEQDMVNKNPYDDKFQFSFIERFKTSEKTENPDNFEATNTDITKNDIDNQSIQEENLSSDIFSRLPFNNGIKIIDNELKKSVYQPIVKEIDSKTFKPRINGISSPITVNNGEEIDMKNHQETQSIVDIKTKNDSPKHQKSFIEEFKEKQQKNYKRNTSFILPSTDILRLQQFSDREDTMEELEQTGKKLKRALADFSIDVSITDIKKGPVITRFEVQPAPGIKVSKIVGLTDDIAMKLAAQRVRIVAPVPGRSVVGIEIPNRKRRIVTLREVVDTAEFQTDVNPLTFALGKDITGSPIIANLADMPHLLIAGSTGSGKSVLLNTIICSLLFHTEPDFLKFIFIDPKMVELKVYDDIPNLLSPVITDISQATRSLQWVTNEMEERYKLLSELKIRDIKEYNEKVMEMNSGLEPLPYIVVIIDELADITISTKDVEISIVRLAQKARAVGIHLILATQRPSVDVITGIIKANFPARIGFFVPSKIDSRTILDQNGAEALLGKGDMLFLQPGKLSLKRVQGAFISTEEVEETVEYLKSQGAPDYIEEITEKDESSYSYDEDVDELFEEATEIIINEKRASASFLQRRLKIGYNRAARLIEALEDRGIVGPANGAKPREILIGVA